MTERHAPPRWSRAALALTLALTWLPGAAQDMRDRFGHPSAAGVPESLPTAPGGRCPPAAEAPKDCDFRCQRERMRSASTRQIILETVPLYEDLERTRPLPGLMRFGNRVRVLHWKAGATGSHFVKFESPTGPQCGWVETAALLAEERDHPLTIGELGAAGIAGFDLRGKGKALDAKVLVRNEFDKKDPQAAEGAQVWYRYEDAYKDGAKPYKKVRIFNILNVYDYAEYKGEVWYFVGGIKETAAGGQEQLLHGWVRDKDVIPWGTLVNVWYSPGKHGVRFYETDKDAEDKKDWFAVQGEDETEPDSYNIPRFPLLDTLHLPDKLIVHEIAVPLRDCDAAGRCAPAGVGKAWVRQEPADPDFGYWVSLKPGQLEDILSKANNLCEVLSLDSPDLDLVREAMVAILTAVTGYSPEVGASKDESIRVFLSKALQVPVEQFPVLLARSLNDFVQWYSYAPPAESKEFQVLMCKKAGLLKLALNKQRVPGDLDDIDYIRGTGWGPKPGTARPFDWLWKTEAGVGYFYIPLNYIL